MKNTTSTLLGLLIYMSLVLTSCGGSVKGKNLKVAGDRFNNDIIAYIRNE